jgi:hypothetical protein
MLKGWEWSSLTEHLPTVLGTLGWIPYKRKRKKENKKLTCFTSCETQGLNSYENLSANNALIKNRGSKITTTCHQFLLGPRAKKIRDKVF